MYLTRDLTSWARSQNLFDFLQLKKQLPTRKGGRATLSVGWVGLPAVGLGYPRYTILQVSPGVSLQGP